MEKLWLLWKIRFWSQWGRGKKGKRETKRDAVAEMQTTDDGLGGISREVVKWRGSGYRLQEKTTNKNSQTYFCGV